MNMTKKRIQFVSVCFNNPNERNLILSLCKTFKRDWHTFLVVVAQILFELYQLILNVPTFISIHFKCNWFFFVQSDIYMKIIVLNVIQNFLQYTKRVNWTKNHHKRRSLQKRPIKIIFVLIALRYTWAIVFFIQKLPFTLKHFLVFEERRKEQNKRKNSKQWEDFAIFRSHLKR